MKIKFLLSVCLSLVCILCSGCESCYKPPDITGAADDGIWLYSGNYRFRSDLSEREELVAAIEIGGEVYDDLDVTYCEYAGGDIVYLYTHTSFIAEIKKGYDWAFVRQGLYVYDAAGGKLQCLAAASEEQSADIDVETGYYITGSLGIHGINGEYVGFADNYALMYFDTETFTSKFVCDFSAPDADWKFKRVCIENGYLIFEGREREVDYNKRAYFNIKSNRFVPLPPLLPKERPKGSTGNGEYYFYYKYYPGGLMSSEGWTALRRVNIKSGKDDVMWVSGLGEDVYAIDAVRAY